MFAQNAGGISVVLGARVDLINCTIYSNAATARSRKRAALNVEGGSKLWLGNGTRFENNSFFVGAAER